MYWIYTILAQNCGEQDWDVRLWGQGHMVRFQRGRVQDTNLSVFSLFSFLNEGGGYCV